MINNLYVSVCFYPYSKIAAQLSISKLCKLLIFNDTIKKHTSNKINYTSQRKQLYIFWRHKSNAFHKENNTHTDIDGAKNVSKVDKQCSNHERDQAAILKRALTKYQKSASVFQSVHISCR